MISKVVSEVNYIQVPNIWEAQGGPPPPNTHAQPTRIELTHNIFFILSDYPGKRYRYLIFLNFFPSNFYRRLNTQPATSLG